MDQPKKLATHVLDGRHGKFTVRVLEMREAIWVCTSVSWTKFDLPQAEADAEELNADRWMFNIGTVHAKEAKARGLQCYLIHEDRMKMYTMNVDDNGVVSASPAEIKIDED